MENADLSELNKVLDKAVEEEKEIRTPNSIESELGFVLSNLICFFDYVLAFALYLEESFKIYILVT